MLPLPIAATVFLFLLVGAVVFLVCVLIPRLRRYALSAALWCAVWGPATLGFLLLAATGFIADTVVTQNAGAHPLQTPKLLAAVGWSYLSASVLITALFASLVAWLHQVLMHRLTFALFRLYTTAVCAGIGSVFGWLLGGLLLWHEFRFGRALWISAMLVLIVGFGTAAYKGARSLRGEPPAAFTWISAEEFNGT